MRLFNEALKITRQESPILFWIVIINFVGAIFCIVGIFVDDRIVMGINVWIKPFKFFVSTGIYTLTAGFLITLYPYSRLRKNITNNIVSWSLLIEMVIITSQAARGVQSHFNFTSAFDSILFALMGFLITINVLIMVLFAFDTLRLKLSTTKPIQWAIFLGWVTTIIGSWVGGQMIGQMAHNVGIQDGYEGLPLLNWSTVAGDLRVAHFFGLHGLQILPLFAFFLLRRWKEQPNHQLLIITIFALLYASFIFYTFYQASQGIPFLT